MLIEGVRARCRRKREQRSGIERETELEKEERGGAVEVQSVLPSFTVVPGSEWLSSSLSVGPFDERGAPRLISDASLPVSGPTSRHSSQGIIIQTSRQPSRTTGPSIELVLGACIGNEPARELRFSRCRDSTIIHHVLRSHWLWFLLIDR